MTTRDELVAALAGRYALGSRADRGRMLDEFATLTGHHRKHAMRLLRAGMSSGRSSPRPERRIYDQATREALIVVWEASDRVCGKRLQPLVPTLVSAMERHGHLQLAPEVLTSLLTMSAATMDRALRGARGATGGRPRRRSPPSAAIRRSVAVRTFSDWDDPLPGFMEADLVAHSGPTAKGSYVQTLGSDRYRDWLDGMRAGPGARAEAADGSAERTRASCCRSPCLDSIPTTTACS